MFPNTTFTYKTINYQQSLSKLLIHILHCFYQNLSKKLNHAFKKHPQTELNALLFFLKIFIPTKPCSFNHTFQISSKYFLKAILIILCSKINIQNLLDYSKKIFLIVGLLAFNLNKIKMKKLHPAPIGIDLGSYKSKIAVAKRGGV